MHFGRLLLSLTLVSAALAQNAKLRPASDFRFPFQVDGNSPSLWMDGRLVFFTSDGRPVVATGDDQFRLGRPVLITVDRQDHMPMWIESVWQDEDGTIYGWYHNEPANVCRGGGLTAPRIGAVVSTDNGYTFQDLGLILTAGDPADCSSRNGFFAGGHGDFSVILDQRREFFYFYFTHYGGPAEGQGIGTARLAFEDRANPVGRLFKYHSGEWAEPGLGGRTTPVFRARSVWQRSDYDSYWGPAVHWNTHLQQYVIVMNHACCGFEWPQEGIYISYNADPAEPLGWTQPRGIVFEMAWRPGSYPQVIGLGRGETDTLVGQVGRLYIQGRSVWEIVFERPNEMPLVIWPEEQEPPAGGDELPVAPEVLNAPPP